MRCNYEGIAGFVFLKVSNSGGKSCVHTCNYLCSIHVICHINQSSIISLNSFLAFVTFIACLLSETGTKVGLPGAL